MGSLSLAPDVVRTIKEKLRQPAGAASSPMPNLTGRELEVLRGVAHGLSNQDIANKLGIETLTIRSHISIILNKLELANRTQAALYALELGPGRSTEKS